MTSKSSVPPHDLRFPLADRRTGRNAGARALAPVATVALAPGAAHAIGFIDDALVARTAGFFQTSMYLDNAHLGDGFPVRCGPADATPSPVPTPAFTLHYGKSYSHTIRARDSANLYSANYGTVICPPKP